MPADDEHAAERGVGAIAFPDAPRLELDELLTQLINRAEDVLGAQGRLRGLLSATQMVIGDLALPVVLRRIVEAACKLVHARYGALGVLAEDGGLAEFVSVGGEDREEYDGATCEAPELYGLLGALTDGGRPIRLDSLSDDPRTAEIPPGHPALEGFLGVPLRVREEVFGNLYLCSPESGSFTAEDEELLVALATTAGVSIENARLFDEARRRQEWLQASAQITRHLLSVEGEDPLAVIARQAAQLADADAVSVVLPTPDGEQLMVEVTVGPGAEALVGYTYPMANTYGGRALSTGRPVLVPDVLAGDGASTHLAKSMQIGPLMVLPLVGGKRARGALLLGRTVGRPTFEHSDLGMATTFANHAALALELADARDDRQRMILLEDRDRIARDLHDHVIQRLFAAGLSVQSVASGIDDAAKQDRLERAVGDIDDTIRQIRTSIFQLRGALGPQTTTVRSRLLDVVADVTALLGFEPEVRFVGPVDTAVPERAVDDLLAVAREGLTNVARHAAASHVRMELRADSGTLTLEIADDGVGVGETGRRSGLTNLRMRAERFGGSFEITAASPSADEQPGHDARGTRLRWTIPLN